MPDSSHSLFFRIFIADMRITVLHMKRIIMAAAAVLVAAACNSQTPEQKTEAYQNKCNAIMEEYHASSAAVQEDTTLTDAQKEAKFEELGDKAMAALYKASVKVIRHDPDSELALSALQSIYYFTEPEKLEALIAKLGPTNKENDFVKKITASLGAKKNTAEGKMFTDFEVVQYPDAEDTRTVRLSDYVGKGKYVLVDFWASWCGPCKREIPNVKAVYDTYAGDQFDVLSVAVWDQPQASIDTAAFYGVNWNQIVNAQRIPTDLYGIDGIPQLILFGPDGTILKRNLRGEEIASEVAARLGR